ncbi:MAG: ADP-ribosylglycohydrolase family protein [Janthinobacterium lividum]
MTLNPTVLERIYAGVLGKLIGVYSGRPFEGWTYARIMAELGPIDRYVHEHFDAPLVVTDDDIAGTFTFVRALADNEYDPMLDADRIGDVWLNYLVENRSILWWGGFGNSTEETAWRRLKAGTRAPASGSIATNGRTVAEQIGAQIFIDGWAMVSPGRPEQAARFARAAATVSHDGEAVHAAVLLAVMEAAAFTEKDLEVLLDCGLAAIPDNCLIASIVADVRNWCRSNADWRQTRTSIENRYGYHLYPGNCHVVPNFAVVLMALLHGGDDFDRVVMIANTAGWDTDCNAGNAACLTGIRLGLGCIDGGGVGLWRGPVADRLFLSSADGGAAINDAVQVSYALYFASQILAGVPVTTPPKQGARFHFSLPGSVQGFAADSGGTLIENAVSPDGSRQLAIRYDTACFVSTPTFAPPDVDRMRTYELIACPTLYSGQTLKARLIADPGGDRELGIALAILVYTDGDIERRFDSPVTILRPGEAVILDWVIPELGGQPVGRVGVVCSKGGGAASGAFHLDWLDWSGEPATTLRRPDGPGRFWRRAWVNAVSNFSESFPEAFRLSQNDGLGLLLQGTREWRNYRVESAITVCLGGGGLAARMQGLRRGYLLMLMPDNRLVLFKLLDSKTQILQEIHFTWALDVAVRLALTVTGARLQAEADGRVVFDLVDEHRPYNDGAIGFALETGTLSADTVSVTPSLRRI